MTARQSLAGARRGVRWARVNELDRRIGALLGEATTTLREVRAAAVADVRAEAGMPAPAAGVGNLSHPVPAAPPQRWSFARIRRRT